jgi:hypothetical protein
MMMGLSGEPEVAMGPGGPEDKRLVPKSRHGVKTMSIGYLLEDDKPVVWRGPMVHKLIEQFLSQVDWGPLDYLVVDMPPGTGDAQLSLAQIVPLSGAVLVTTPQAVSTYDVSKAIAMFRRSRSTSSASSNMSGCAIEGTVEARSRAGEALGGQQTARPRDGCAGRFATVVNVFGRAGRRGSPRKSSGTRPDPAEPRRAHRRRRGDQS